MAGDPLNRREDERAERRAQVSELILSGFSQRAIAARLQVGVGTVNRDLQDIRQEWAEQRTGKWEEHVGAMMARLTQLERVLARPLAEGDLAAMDRALKILDRRAKLLGLDAPQSLSVGFDIDEARQRITEFLDNLDAAADTQPD